eukprot:6383139-Pyramimonas_sp.AAC.1
MADLRERMQQLETSSGTGSSGKRHLTLLSAMDVSNRRVAFVGFDGDDRNARVLEINRYAASLQNVPNG